MNDDIWDYNFIDCAMKESTFISQYEGKFIQTEAEESLKSIKDMMMDQMSKEMDDLRRKREIKNMTVKWYDGEFVKIMCFGVVYWGTDTVGEL